MESTDDDYYYDSFVNYQETTNDPGPWMLVGVLSYSVCCILLLPILVQVSNKRKRKRARSFQRNVQCSTTAGGEIEIVAAKGERKTQNKYFAPVESSLESSNEPDGDMNGTENDAYHVS
jgi:hypothetical protein